MSAINNLDPFFSSIINSVMLSEKQPLTRLTTQYDQLNVKKGVYKDLDKELDGLQSLVQGLISTDPEYTLDAAYKTLVSGTNGAKVLTATPSSDAVPGTYTIDNITLATTHRVNSDQQVYDDQALGLAGTFTLGGAVARSQSTTATIADTVTAFSAVAPESGQTELGTETFYVETRNDATEGWQFRLVDSEGKAVSVKMTDDSGNYTANWQSIEAGGGAHDTGRGLEITFGADDGLYVEASRTTSDAAEVDFTAQGVGIDIIATDSLQDIATLINAGSYASGNEVTATVVDNQLILSAGHSGLGYDIIASDTSGTVLETLGVLTGAGAFKNTLDTATNASFDVNGLNVVRSTNSGIDDVITGITLDLASDAEGESASLVVNENTSPATKSIASFIKKFNSTQIYIGAKTSITSETVDGNKEYSRGPLASDSVFKELRADMFGTIISTHTNDGAYQSLRAIGISLDDGLLLTISDSSLLSEALENNLADVTALIDAVMTKIDANLGRFTGSDGYLDLTVENFEAQALTMDTRITDFNKYLEEREEYLILQYAEFQATVMNLGYQRQQMAQITSITSQFY